MGSYTVDKLLIDVFTEDVLALVANAVFTVPTKFASSLIEAASSFRVLSPVGAPSTIALAAVVAALDALEALVAAADAELAAAVAELPEAVAELPLAVAELPLAVAELVADVAELEALLA